jgi:hypothetical protein
MVEIRRVLKPSGICVLVVPSEHQLTRGFWNDYTHVRPYTKVSLVQLARLNGFSRATAAELAYTRFLSRLLVALGPERTYRCLEASDRFLRRLHIVNRDMLTLVCYRD